MYNPIIANSVAIGNLKPQQQSQPPVGTVPVRVSPYKRPARQYKSSESTRKRDNDLLGGWEDYNRIAYRLAWKWNRRYFPTMDDLKQAAALAASEALALLGERTTMKELSSVVQHVLYEQVKAYGKRTSERKGPNGERLRKTFNTYVSLPELLSRSKFGGAGSDEPCEFQETRMMILGVGEYTRKHAYFLYELLH